MISSRNGRVFSRDLSDFTWQIGFDAWWASINEGSKCPSAWNNSRHAPWRRFYLHCATEKTGSPGIICIVCHQVLRNPSEHGTSLMEKLLLAKAHIAKLNELPQEEDFKLASTTADETELAMLNRKGSRGIRFLSSQKKFIFDSAIHCVWIQFTENTLQMGSKGLPNCQIAPRHLESQPHVRI